MITVEQVKQKIANPLIKVEPFEGPRKGHWYRAFSTKTGEEIAAFPSVTGQLQIIGGGKTYGLMYWAKKLTATELLKLLAEEARVKGRHLDAFTPQMVDLLRDKKDCGLPWVDLCYKMALQKDREELKKAGSDGSKVHMMIDAHIAGVAPDITDITDVARTGFNNFMKFVFERELEFVAGDTPVISLKYKYGGRLDALAVEHGELVLLDWKTGNAIRDDAACQGVAYNIAALETLGIKAKKVIVCRFDKTAPGYFEYREVNLKGAEKAWLHAHKLHNAFRPPLLWRDHVKTSQEAEENE